MRRPHTCLSLAFLAIQSGLVLAPGGQAADEAKRPNILFIYTDDHSHRTVSCYPEAYDWVNTPNIDNLAKRGVHGNTLTDWVRQYHQGVLAIDEGVGQLMASLKDTDQLDNTLVVFTSDQGFGWGQHGFCTKLAPYDATIRSPMIVSMPGSLPEGAVCESPVGGVDIVPTFFNFAGIELPWKMHGYDLTPMLKSPAVARKEPVLTTLTGRRYGSDTDVVPTDPEDLELSGVPWWVSLVSGRLKYIRALKEGQIEELYDLANDPEELTNLALSREYASKLMELRAATIAELRRTDAGLVDSLPPVKTAF